MDFAGIPAIGAGSPAQRPVPEPVRPAVPAIEPSVSGQQVSDRFSGNASGGGAGSAGFGGGGSRASRPDTRADVLTGPPPAFEASLLDLEADLRRTIARLEAERGQRESSVAVKPAAERRPPEPAPEPASAPAQAEPAVEAAAEPAPSREPSEPKPQAEAPRSSEPALG